MARDFFQTIDHGRCLVVLLIFPIRHCALLSCAVPASICISLSYFLFLSSAPMVSTEMENLQQVLYLAYQVVSSHSCPVL